MDLSRQQRLAMAELGIREARKDIGAFNLLVYRNEDGQPWETTSFQREWHDLIADHDWPLDQDGEPIVRLVIFAPAGHGKTGQIARSWITRCVGENPNKHAAILCNEHSAAKKRLLAIREDIENNARLLAVYPKLRRHPRQPWTDSALYCDRDVASVDPTLQAVGIHGALIGARLHYGVMDDPSDMENTATVAQRKKTIRWINSTFVSRFDSRGQIVCIMTSWDEDDVGHLLIKEYGWKGVRYEACDENFENLLWPERFDADALRRLHSGEGAVGPVEFARQYRNVIMDDTFRRIKMEDIQKALDRGLGIQPGEKPNGAVATICGVDPAGGRSKRKGDFSALFTFSVMPNGDRCVIDAELDRITSPELRRKIETKWNLWSPLIVAESNGVQIWLEQEVVVSSAVQIMSIDTGKEKWDPATGVESIGIELHNGKWVIPSVEGAGGRAVPATPGLQAWVDQMANFEINSHTGDLLMASYIGRCKAREIERNKNRRRATNIVVPSMSTSGGWSV